MKSRDIGEVTHLAHLTSGCLFQTEPYGKQNSSGTWVISGLNKIELIWVISGLNKIELISCRTIGITRSKTDYARTV